MGYDEAMGYGDYRCTECGYIYYSETEKDFLNRIYGKKKRVKEEVEQEI